MQEILAEVSSIGLVLVVLGKFGQMKFVQALPGGDEGEIEVPLRVQNEIRARGRNFAERLAVAAFERYNIEWVRTSTPDGQLTYWFPKGR